MGIETMTEQSNEERSSDERRLHASEKKHWQDQLAAQVEQLKQANEELKAARDQAIEANHMKSQFVANTVMKLEHQ